MEQLIQQFIDRYLPRKEIIHRLPLSQPISQFWPALQSARKKLAIKLPLPDQSGNPFWFVLNQSIEQQCDKVAEMARRDAVFDAPVFEAMVENAVIDEAVFSSMIEGAFTSREEAAKFIRNRKQPANKSEHMIKNNYDALTYALEHLNEPITEQTIIEIARIVTRNAAEVAVESYRAEPVYVTGRETVVYTPPEAKKVPAMMRALVQFIQTSELHPVLKACIAHFYFVYVHPFGDGNGRTARALSYMMLIQSGYEFFRYFSISNLVSDERGKYYRSMVNVEEDDGDMTYFIDFYSSMLSRSVIKMEDHLTHHVLAEQRLKELQARGDLNSRQLAGAKWLLEGTGGSVTVETWKKRYKVVQETARRDLMKLCDIGVLTKAMEGRKAVFNIVR
ncbi:MAG: Fic family protein [Clostridia bacterium]|nr:Fic family protein [Clostridia bacterium]